MGRYVTGFVLLFIAIGANSQDDAVALAENNTVIKVTGICAVCVCTETKVNCNEQNLESFFSLEEWRNLTDIKPTKVDLVYNYLTTVTALPDLPIEKLDLSYNLIENIDNGAFRDLEELRVLDLSFNRLTSNLSPHAFEGHYSPEEYKPLASMRVLNLANNDFHSLDQDLFEHLPELTTLDLTGNPLFTINYDTMIAISSLPMLKELRLGICELSEIPDQFLRTPRFLERLDLSGNRLTSVPRALENAKYLEYLNLNMNPIKELDMEADEVTSFPRLPKLRELHMSTMPKLTRIGSGALGALERLAILHLSFNPKLTDIHPRALAKLGDNNVYDWPIIKELYLQYNNLSGIDHQLVARWDLVEKMDLSGNPFLCDCSTQWMVDELVTVVEMTRVNGSETLVCQQPKEMRGYTLQHLQYVKLPCRDETEVDEVIIPVQPDFDGFIVPHTYIAVWLFLPIPIFMGLVLYRRRKSSLNYEKLALAEENYI